MPVGLCWVVLYEGTEHHAKMGHSCLWATCMSQMVPVGHQAQHHRSRLYAPNQALEYPQEVHMGHHGAWVGHYCPYYAPSNIAKKKKFYLRDPADIPIV